MKRYATVDQYIAAAVKWREELVELRNILNGTELEETVKWGQDHAPDRIWPGTE